MLLSANEVSFSLDLAFLPLQYFCSRMKVADNMQFNILGLN